MATSGDFFLATSGDFLMAMDIHSGTFRGRKRLTEELMTSLHFLPRACFLAEVLRASLSECPLGPSGEDGRTTRPALSPCCSREIERALGLRS